MDTISDNHKDDDKIVLHLTQRDVSAIAVLINAGAIGLQGTQNTMKMVSTLPPAIEKYIDDTAHNAGIVYERIMKLARAKWPVPEVAEEKVAPELSVDKKTDQEV